MNKGPVNRCAGGVAGDGGARRNGGEEGGRVVRRKEGKIRNVGMVAEQNQGE